MDITAFLHKGLNLLSVMTDNQHYDHIYPQVADFTFYGGLYRDVRVLTVPKTHFCLDYYGSEGITACSEIKNGNQVQLSLHAYVSNAKETDQVLFSIYDQEGSLIAQTAQPLIHCITNPISIHDCANIILAAGGRPIMAEHPAEVAEITSHAQSLALNLGNITDARMKSMPESLKIAASLHIPVMLDLVGTACSNLRYEFAQKLMNIHMPELLKGNMSELLAMSGQTAHAIGIDAGVQDVLTDVNRSHLKELFQEKASQWNTTLLITGKEDMIVSASKCEFITNGTPAMSQITGTGCMLGMICATYLAVTDPFTAALSAAREFGTAGERAEKNSSGPGSFQTELFDQFYNLL